MGALIESSVKYNDMRDWKRRPSKRGVCLVHNSCIDCAAKSRLTAHALVGLNSAQLFVHWSLPIVPADSRNTGYTTID